jgi:hypothetical protein
VMKDAPPPLERTTSGSYDASIADRLIGSALGKGSNEQSPEK